MSFTQDHLAGRPDMARRAFELAGVTFTSKRSGAEHRVLCSFHDDTNASMDINLQKAAYLCRSCGEGGDAVRYFAEKRGVSEEEAIVEIRQGLGLPSAGAPVAGPPPTVAKTTRYEIPGDGTSFVHVRRDLSDGSKKFAWERDGKTGLDGMPSSEIPLYGFQHLARRPTDPVIVCEGEKAADAINEHGLLAVGTVTGAPAAPGPKPLEVLRGREVTLWPDPDAPGKEQMRRIGSALLGIAAKVSVFEWGNGKEDAADYFARGGTTDQLCSMLEESETEFRVEANPAPSPKEAIVAPWPKLSEAAVHGLAGEIVHTIDPHTEADPVAVLVQFLTMFGSAVGPSPYFEVGADRHSANLFTLIVGTTSKGRKGTSEGQARRIFKYCAPDWEKERVAHGLSSGEGLISAVRDEDKGGEDEGGQIMTPKDPRLLVIESEFAGTLRVMRRDGNTLSSVIRQAWDSGNLRVMTRRDPLVASGAHISMIGHITNIELLRLLGETDASNGFANRFLWILARRSKELPEGGNLTDAQLIPLGSKVEKALDEARRTTQVPRSPAALSLWKSVYSRLSAGHPGLFGAVTSRAEAQVIRLSLVYALLDRSKVIEEVHLRAALALWDYSESSARQIFGDMLGDPVADRVLKELRIVSPSELTRTEIGGLFGKNLRGGEIERALTTLEAAGLANRDTNREPGPGRPAERWFASARN